MWVNTQSEIISKVLPPAVRLFLRTQVEQIEDLEMQLHGHDRQILRGYIPGVFLAVGKAIYQGLHLGKAQLRGENIRLNIGQVLRGKPLKILEPIRVSGEVEINEQDLNNSIASTILVNAFADLLIFSLENNGVVNAREIISQQRFNWKNVLLNQGYFSLLGHRETGAEVIFTADITLKDARTLGISPRQWQGLAPDLSIDLQPFTVDLGKDVEIKSFILDDQTLFCQGSFLILP
ncbi:DUF2993 domain-containing protein [Microcystis aeruginosa]